MLGRLWASYLKKKPVYVQAEIEVLDGHASNCVVCSAKSNTLTAVVVLSGLGFRNSADWSFPSKKLKPRSFSEVVVMTLEYNLDLFQEELDTLNKGGRIELLDDEEEGIKVFLRGVKSKRGKATTHRFRKPADFYAQDTWKGVKRR